MSPLNDLIVYVLSALDFLLLSRKQNFNFQKLKTRKLEQGLNVFTYLFPVVEVETDLSIINFLAISIDDKTEKHYIRPKVTVHKCLGII